jgi:Xaa-Pro aminopeptidase
MTSSEPALLIYGDTERSADLFHAIPRVIGDPFLYAEVDGHRIAFIHQLDADKALESGAQVVDPYTLGRDELLAQGLDLLAVDVELALRACRASGIEGARVPPDFPLAVADHLRANGVELVVDAAAFIARRRVKTPAELAGLRRAQAAADAAMGVAAQLLAELPPGLRSEDVRAAMREACEARGATLGDDVVVAHGAQGAIGHEAGHGEIPRGEGVIVDIWPRDRTSRCWADMTRTFVAGGEPPSQDLAQAWRLARESLELVRGEVRAGASCAELYARSCEPFEAAGVPTQRTKEPGTVLEEGYYHALGHGVGLEVHERPYLGRSPDVLVAGDVIAVEPGAYRRATGGARLEDLLLVTEDGCEVLTDFPYGI